MRSLNYLLLGSVLFAFTSLSNADERKVVFDLTSGDAERIETRLLNGIKFLSDYYEEQNIELKVVVVISGKSYKYFIDDLANSPYKDEKALVEVQNKFRPLLKELNDEYGVRFDMCASGMKTRNITAESLYSFVHSDKVQPVYMIDWQNEGYAYMPMN